MVSIRRAIVRPVVSEKRLCVRHTYATERVDTHSGRVLAAASRIGTGVAERQRDERAGVPDAGGGPGVGQYLIRLDMMWERRATVPPELCPLELSAHVCPRLRPISQVCPGLLHFSTLSTVLTSSDAHLSDGRRSRTRDISLTFRFPGLSHKMHARRSSPPPTLIGRIIDDSEA